MRRRPNRAPSHPAGIDPTSVDTATAMKPSDALPTVVWNRSEPYSVNQLENDWNAIWNRRQAAKKRTALPSTGGERLPQRTRAE